MSSDSPVVSSHALFETIGSAVAVVLLLLTGAITWSSISALQRNREMVRHTHDVLLTLVEIESVLKDAETGQRGFIITGREDYLEPFISANDRIGELVFQLQSLTRDNGDQQERIENLKSLIEERFVELRRVMDLRRDVGIDAAVQRVLSDVGKLIMDRIRNLTGEMRSAENDLLASREVAAESSYWSGLSTSVLSTIAALGSVGSVLYVVQHNRRRAERAAILLNAEKENLRVTLSSIGDAVIATDVEGRVTSLNSVAEKLTGWTSETAKGTILTEVFKIVNATTRQPVDNPAFRAIAEGAVVGLANHTILLSENGLEYPIDDSAAPIRNMAGDVIGSVLVFRDISDRHRDTVNLAERYRLTELRAAVSAACAATEEIHAALQLTCEAMIEHIGVAVARVWIRDKTESVLELQSSAGLNRDLNGPSRHILVGQSKIGLIAKNRKPDLSPCAQDDLEISDQEWAKQESIVAFAGYPLIVDERIVGVVAMFSRHPLSEGILKEVQPIADFLAQFIDRKRQEASRADALAALNASEERLRMALDSADLGTWNIDPSSNTLTCDAQFQFIFGKPNSSITYEEAFECIHPDDRQHVRQAVAAAMNPIAPVPYEAEYRIVLPTGSHRWVAAKGRANCDSHQVISFSGTVADITERKQIESLRQEVETQFQMLANNIPQLAWIAEPGSDGKVDWFNQNWYDYTGTTPEQMMGDGWQQVHHPKHADRVIKKFKEHVRRNVDWEDTFPLRGSDGQYRWFLSRMRAIRDRHGAVIKIFGTNTDVTDQQNMAESLRISAAELSEINRRKNEFLATLAHELRNPLAPIKNAVQLMGMTKLDPASEDLRQMMARQVEQLVRLIDDLLDVSRISRGKISLRREVIDLASVVEAAVEASLSFINQNAQVLEVACPRDTIFVNADPARITQVISNLLNNAAKYSRAGCHIALSVARKERTAEVCVRDNGMGIEAHRLEDIFQLFSQVNETFERGSAGLGIGLTLVKTLVEMHGGTVTAESDGLECGSLFTVQLPLTEIHVTAALPSKVETPNSRRAFRILIVEDQLALRVVLTRLLEKMGHQVRAVDGGIAALEIVDDYHPDLVFSDISMPGMSGYELAKLLRQRDDMRDVFFVAMTGFGHESDRNLAIESGFNEHMVKPVDVDRLQSLFNRMS